MEKKIGRYSYVIGVLIALLLGIFGGMPFLATSTPYLLSLLVLLGLIVGFINVTDKETKDFLMVSTILVIVAFVGGASANLSTVQWIGSYLGSIFSAIMTFVIPATVVVGLKSITAMAKN